MPNRPCSPACGFRPATPIRGERDAEPRQRPRGQPNRLAEPGARVSARGTSLSGTCTVARTTRSCSDQNIIATSVTPHRCASRSVWPRHCRPGRGERFLVDGRGHDGVGAPGARRRRGGDDRLVRRHRRTRRSRARRETRPARRACADRRSRAGSASTTRGSRDGLEGDLRADAGRIAGRDRDDRPRARVIAAARSNRRRSSGWRCDRARSRACASAA